MLKGAAMYDLFGDKFDLNHDGRLSAAEHMMDFSVFNYWATEDDDDDDAGVDRDRSSESYFDDDNDFDNCDSDDSMMISATISRTMTKKMTYGNRLTKSESTLMNLSR